MLSDSQRQARDALLSGMIHGWASRLEDPNEVKDTIKDMLEFSDKLAMGAGVTLFDKNTSK